MIPCCAGASPVAIDVSAVAVVEGTTVVIGPPVMLVRVGNNAACSCTAAQPKPSRTSRTTASAVRAGSGIHDASRTPRNAGTRPATDAPSKSGRTAPSARRCIEAAYAAAPRDDGAMKVSTRGDYAARALLSLALHSSERPTSVKEIAERTHLPQPYLEQILLSVKGAGLVRSKRGVGGGYVLARPPHAITLADIVSAVEGPQIVLAEHPDHCEGHCILQ